MLSTSIRLDHTGKRTRAAKSLYKQQNLHYKAAGQAADEGVLDSSGNTSLSQDLCSAAATIIIMSHFEDTTVHM